MQLSRALFLSSERTRYHGACFVSVAASMASRAREYSYQRRTDSKSIRLSLLSVVIGSSRNPTSSYQMLGLFFFTIPNPNWDKRDANDYQQTDDRKDSKAGKATKSSSFCCHTFSCCNLICLHCASAS